MAADNAGVIVNPKGEMKGTQIFPSNIFDVRFVLAKDPVSEWEWLADICHRMLFLSECCARYDFWDEPTDLLIGFLATFAGSAITGPIGKECADLWPRIASAANAIVWGQ